MTQRVLGVTGWKNCGKTGLVERLVAEFVRRGHSVSTMKHAHHEVDVDQPGRDSYRHRAAGAREVLVSSGARWALMHELRDEPEPSLDALVEKLSPVDLVIVEGFKRSSHPKIEAHREVSPRPLLALSDPTIMAVASDVQHRGLQIPVFPLDDTGAIADFAEVATGLRALARSG